MPAPLSSPLHDILRYDDMAVKFLFEHYYVSLPKIICRILKIAKT